MRPRRTITGKDAGTLCVLVSATAAAEAEGFKPRPDHHQGDAVTVRLDRRAYSPVLRQANLPNDTRIPWWGNRTLRYELT